MDPNSGDTAVTLFPTDASCEDASCKAADCAVAIDENTSGAEGAPLLSAEVELS